MTVISLNNSCDGVAFRLRVPESVVAGNVRKNQKSSSNRTEYQIDILMKRAGLFDPFLFLVKVTRSNTIFDRYFYFFAINPESDVQRSFPAFVDSSLHKIKNWHLLYFILFPKNDLFPENRREDLLNNSYLSRRVIC